MAIEKKFQVFVSSTYRDLLEERQEIIQALLELDCIPVGMELFPAADDDQWTLIKGLIDDCDYYVLILAGRYGSIGPDGKSYTQMEYEYALEQGIPIISFIHSDTSKIEAGKSEKDAETIKKLEEFKALAQKKMCKFWTSPADLGSQVSRSLVKLIKTKPRTGWIKADILTSEEANQELLKLRKHVSDLEAQLVKAQTTAPKGSESLQQGSDEFTLRYNYYHAGNHDVSKSMTWNEIFYLVAPLMVDEATEGTLKNELIRFLKEEVNESASTRPRVLEINSTDFQTIKIQLIALGLIETSDKKRSIKDAGTYWSLTLYGRTVMMQLRALKK